MEDLNLSNFDLLTEKEAAEILQCGVGKVAELRWQRRLAYFRSHPILIKRADLDEYIDCVKRGAFENASARAAKKWTIREMRGKSSPPQGGKKANSYATRPGGIDARAKVFK